MNTSHQTPPKATIVPVHFFCTSARPIFVALVDDNVRMSSIQYFKNRATHGPESYILPMIHARPSQDQSDCSVQAF